MIISITQRSGLGTLARLVHLPCVTGLCITNPLPAVTEYFQLWLQQPCQLCPHVVVVVGFVYFNAPWGYAVEPLSCLTGPRSFADAPGTKLEEKYQFRRGCIGERKTVSLVREQHRGSGMRHMFGTIAFVNFDVERYSIIKLIL